MRIFYKRPLSLILCIMLGAFVFFSFYEHAPIRLTAISLIVIFLIFTFIKPSLFREKNVFLRVLAICSLISMLFSFLYFDLWFKAYERYEEDVKIVGTVEEIQRNSYSAQILIKTDDINGTAFSNYKLIAYVNNEKYYGYSIGSRVEFTGTIEGFTALDTSFDVKSYNFSHGISGIVRTTDNFKILDIGKPTFSHKIWSLRQTLCRRLIYASGADIGGLLSALLLGEKSYLPSGTKLNFSRIGISHVLALSGLHLAILALGFSRLLALLRVGKKEATVTTIIFTLLYMAVTGFSVSVVRAGIMLIVSSLLYLLARTKDSMTSLFVSVSLICLLEPYSIFDLSLWLSAFATLGIVVMSEYQSEKYSKPSFAKWLITSFLSTVFAISSTIFITIPKFDGVSLLSPISTLIFSFLVEIFLYIGLLLLAFGGFFPIKFLLTTVGYAIIHLAKFFSGLDWIYVSTNFTAIKTLAIFFTLAFFAFFIFKIRKKKATLAILTSWLAVIFILSAALTYTNQRKTDIVYLDQNNEQILITDKNEISAIEIATYDEESAYGIYEVLADNKITHLDKYVVTHYTYSLEKSISTLTSSLLVKEIYLPLPKNKTEERIFLTISKNLSKESTTVTLYRNEDVIDLCNVSFIPIHRHELGKQKKILFTMLYEDNFYTYLNIDMIYGETKNMALEVIDGSRAIIFGHHETGSEERKFTYKLSEPSIIVFSSNRIKIPTDTLEHYSNCAIYFEAEKISLIR